MVLTLETFKIYFYCNAKRLSSNNSKKYTTSQWCSVTQHIYSPLKYTILETYLFFIPSEMFKTFLALKAIVKKWKKKKKYVSPNISVFKCFYCYAYRRVLYKETSVEYKNRTVFSAICKHFTKGKVYPMLITSKGIVNKTSKT